MGKVQPERGVGVHHVAGALVVVADAAPGRGQQFQQAVVPGTGGLGADLGGDGRNGVLVALLGRHGAQGGSRDDRGVSRLRHRLRAAPPVQSHPDGGPIRWAR
jgi:hypothetical protein